MASHNFSTFSSTAGSLKAPPSASISATVGDTKAKREAFTPSCSNAVIVQKESKLLP